MLRNGEMNNNKKIYIYIYLKDVLKTNIHQMPIYKSIFFECDNEVQCTLKPLIGVPSKSMCCAVHRIKYDSRCSMFLTIANSLKQSKKYQ